MNMRFYGIGIILVCFLWGCKKELPPSYVCGNTKQTIPVYPWLYGLAYANINGEMVSATQSRIDEKDGTYQLCISSGNGTYCKEGREYVLAYRLDILHKNVVAYLTPESSIRVYDLANDQTLASISYGWITDLEFSEADSCIYFISLRSPGYNDEQRRLFKYDMNSGMVKVSNDQVSLADFDLGYVDPTQAVMLDISASDSFAVMKYSLESDSIYDSFEFAYSDYYPYTIEWAKGGVYMLTDDETIYKIDFSNRTLIPVVSGCELGKLGNLETNGDGNLVSVVGRVNKKGGKYYYEKYEMVIE